MADEQVELKPSPKKKGGKLKLLLFIGLPVVLAAAGGVVFAMRGHGPSQPAPTNPGLIAFDPFVVNLADPGGLRFIRVTLQIVVDDEKESVSLAEEPVPMKRARSAILELLSQQTAGELITAEGKAALKKAIIQRVQPILGKTKVSDVLFSEFVVQF